MRLMRVLCCRYKRKPRILMPCKGPPPPLPRDDVSDGVAYDRPLPTHSVEVSKPHAHLPCTCPSGIPVKQYRAQTRNYWGKTQPRAMAANFHREPCEPIEDRIANITSNITTY